MGLLHVHTDRAEEGHDAEPAQHARRGRDGQLPRWELLFWQTERREGGGASATAQSSVVDVLTWKSRMRERRWH